MTDNQKFWSELTRGRQKAVETLPNILKFPIVRDKMELLRNILKDGDRLLDIGANDRLLEKQLREAGLNVKYFSLDVDKNLKHDYYSLDEIKGSFDVITSFEVIEHISPAEITAMFKKAQSQLKEGGYIMVSTPNVCHPVNLWTDCSHITAVRHNVLYYLLSSAGFKDIQIYRGGKIKWKDRLWAFVYRPLLKLLRLDYIRHIIVTGRKV